MYRSVIALALIIIITISTTSCTFIAEYPLDKYRTVGYGYDESLDAYYLEYQDEQYWDDDANAMFNVVHNEGDCAYLGWFFNLPFTLFNAYYSYSTESPDYIYRYTSHGSDVYFKESFDYTKEVFVLENVEIEFCNAFSGDTVSIDDIERNNIEKQSFMWKSKKHSALFISTHIYLFENKVYMFSFNMDSENAYQLSDAFLELLIKNKIIVDI